jgi:Domain of unknown function (DUF4440)
MRTVLILALALAACRTGDTLSASDRQAIADSLTRQVKAAYDLSKPNVEQRLMSLYPPDGRVVSASGGRIIASRDSIAMGIKAFWENVGVNMRQPKWVWDQMIFDVLSPRSAVMTARYHIPHLTPRNMPHVIAGAWTAVFEKRGDRWYVVQEHLSDEQIPDSLSAAMMGMKAMPGMPSNPPRPAKP